MARLTGVSLSAVIARVSNTVLILLAISSSSFAGPICKLTCTPDPTTTGYDFTVVAMTDKANMRGHGSVFGQAAASSTHHGSKVISGSKSYDYQIPILNLPGRKGLDLNLTLFYNSSVWSMVINNMLKRTPTFNADHDFPSYGFRLGFGFLEYTATSDLYTLAERDGTKRKLSLVTAGTYTSTDSSFIQWTLSSKTLLYKNGTRITYELFPGSTTFYRPIQIRDANGNYITINYRTDTWAEGLEINTITDTVNRVITFNYDSTSHELTSIAQGATTYATFHWNDAYTLQYNISGLNILAANAPAAGSVLKVLDGCTYPNATNYAFTYGDWGIVKKIEFKSASGIVRNSQSYNYPTAATALTDVPTFTTQTIFDGVNTPANWNYAYTGTTAVSVTDPYGTVATTNLNSATGLVTSTTIAPAGQSVIRTNTYTWSTGNNPTLSNVVNTLNDSGQQSKTAFLYDTYSNPIEIQEYDFGLVYKRRTTVSYATDSGHTTTAHILNLPIQVKVFDETGTETLKSRIDLVYDEYTLTTPAALQWDSGISAYRGNLTTTKRYEDPTTPGGEIDRHFHYDQLGNLIQADVDCCTQASWTYDSTTNYSYPVQATSGSLTTSTTYYIDSGLPHVKTDANNQNTSYTYDNMFRLTDVLRPDGVHYGNSFDDSATLSSVTSTSPIDVGTAAIQMSTLDGAGRVLQSTLKDISLNIISVIDTSYDFLGRPVLTSNPHASGATPVNTATYYDALGRVIKVVPPDGTFTNNNTTFSFSGNATTVVNPAGQEKRSFTDALGRLIQVDETTSIFYPALNGTGSITLSGTEQSTTTSGTFSTGTVTISGTEQHGTFNTPAGDCTPHVLCYDDGVVWITINGQGISADYGQTSTAARIAADLTASINASSTYAIASVSGTTITLTSRTTGATVNYSLAVSTTFDIDFSHASFTASKSGATLTGGSSTGTTTVFDYGKVSVAVPGFTATVNYSQTLNTPTLVASALASALSVGASPINATASGGTLTLSAKLPGAAGNYVVTSTSATFRSAYFAGSSFSATGTTMAGGRDGSADGLATPLSTTYIYDVRDKLAKVTQGSQTRTFLYNGFGVLTSSQTPEAGTTTFSYVDGAGARCSTDMTNVCRRIDARSILTTYTYDTLNRPAGITYSDGTPSVTYAYDAGGAPAFAKGKLTSMTDGVGSETYTYDVLGRITAVAKIISGTTYNLAYSYDSAGDIKSFTDPSNTVLNQTFDAVGRLNQISSGGTNYLTFPSNSYNAAGLPTLWTYGSSVGATVGYNNRLQLSSLQYSKSGTDLLNLTYNYNQTVGGLTVNNGQIQGITDTRGAAFSEAFTYDGLARLVQGQTNDLTAANTWKIGWTYDRYGNRSAQSLLGGTISTTAPSLTIDPASNRITTGGYTYDAAGNMTSDSLHNYAYDAEGRIKTVDATGAIYSYNGNGQRVKKVAGGTTTVYVFAGNKVVAEYVNGTLSSRYVYSGDQLLATIASGAVTYHLADHLSSRAETDSIGTLTRTFGHLPFGETWYETGTAIKWKFTSYERDSESGLDYAINRYDSSRIARFMTPDPVGGQPGDSQTWNRYAYVQGQPTQLTDPLGLFSKFNRAMGPVPMFLSFSDIEYGIGCTVEVDGLDEPCGLAAAGNEALQCTGYFGGCTGNGIPGQGFFPGDEVDIFDPNAARIAALVLAGAMGDWRRVMDLGLAPIEQDMWNRALNPIYDATSTKDDPCDALCQAVFHSPQAQNTWKQSDCVINGSFKEAAKDVGLGTVYDVSKGYATARAEGIAVRKGVGESLAEGTGTIFFGIFTYGKMMFTVGWRMVAGCPSD